MKKTFFAFLFMLAALAPRAETITMVTVLPDEVAAFVNLNIISNSVLSKVTLGHSGITSTMNFDAPGGQLDLDSLTVGADLNAVSLTATVDGNLNFAEILTDTFVVEGEGTMNATQITTNKLYLNGIELEAMPNLTFAWRVLGPKTVLKDNGAAQVFCTNPTAP